MTVQTHDSSGPRTAKADGQCRRCGWSAPLVKLSRRGRAMLGAPRHLRLVCVDCLADLRAAGTRVAAPAVEVGAPTVEQPSADTPVQPSEPIATPTERPRSRVLVRS